MYLTPTSLIPWLTGRGLISSQAIVRGDLQIAELERNNRCFKVISRQGPSYFVKQVRELDESTVSGLRREAQVYQLAAADPQFAALRKLLPKFAGFDERRHCVMVEFLLDSINAHQYHNRIGHYPPEFGRGLAETLATFHSDLGRQFAAEMGCERFPGKPPWILSFHRDQGDGRLSPANQQLLQFLQDDSELQRILDQLLAGWRLDGLIHRDLKWNNVLVPSDTTASIDLRIIDWEMADNGDWCWDAGMAIQNWWSFQALAAPEGTPVDAEPFLQSSDGLAAIRPAVHEFWSTWNSRTDLQAQNGQPLIEKCVLYTAARILQTAYELLHGATKMSDRAMRLLCLSQHVLKHPDEAVAWLNAVA